MRNDLPSMNAGRAMAQASHASNAFIHKYGKKNDVIKWAKETSQGFGTVIVLAADLIQIESIAIKLAMSKVYHDLVFDPEYCIKVNHEVAELLDAKKYIPSKSRDIGACDVLICRKEITCAYLFGTHDDMGQYIGHLDLHP